MRTITSHLISPAVETLAITVTDKPGAGGANHAYVVHGGYFARNPSMQSMMRAPDVDGAIGILFQNGPIREVGVNGLTQEALLAIVIDRLSSFQNGPFRCAENAMALDHCTAALELLHQRTAVRLRRGVEGTNAV